MHLRILGCAIAAVMLVSPAFAQSSPDANSAPPGNSTTAAGQHYTTDTTTIGDLLADPAAKAILQAHIPTVVNNPQIDQASTMTLKSVQPYAPELTDAALAAIDADLAKLPAK